MIVIFAMPLLDNFKIDLDPETWIGVWEMTENLSFFEKQLLLHEEEATEIRQLKERKKYEWFCSRYLLHLLSEREIRGACLKDDYGKPYLEGSAYFISMSHSHERTAVIASTRRAGIDIQMKVEKIARIADKFLSPAEKDSIPAAHYLEYLHYYWGAKESLYKIYGKKELDFKKHILVDPFEYQEGCVKTTGRIQKGDENISCNITGYFTGSYFLVFALEI